MSSDSPVTEASLRDLEVGSETHREDTVESDQEDIVEVDQEKKIEDLDQFAIKVPAACPDGEAEPINLRLVESAIAVPDFRCTLPWAF